LKGYRNEHCCPEQGRDDSYRNTGEFAGAYMKGGRLIIQGKARGYVGANMKGGNIFYKGDALLPGHSPDEKDIRMLIKILGIGQIEAMMFKKYGP